MNSVERIASLEAKLALAVDALHDCLEFADGYVDVVDGPDGTQRPNDAMVLYSRIEEILGRLK